MADPRRDPPPPPAVIWRIDDTTGLHPQPPWNATAAHFDMLGDGRPWHIEITWALVDGRPEPVGATVTRGCQPVRGGLLPLGEGPAPISAAGWRKLPIASLIRGMRPVMEDANARHADTIASIGTHPVVEQARRQVERSRNKPRRAGRPHVLDDAHLRRVADLYDRAWRNGEDPTLAVAKALVISRSAAAKQIAAARAATCLPPTTRGVAKGNPA